MTKKEYIDLIHEQLGDALRKHIEKPVVEGEINNVYNQIVYDLVRSGIRNFDLCRKRYPSVAVAYDSVSAVYYSTWPAAIVPHINGEMIVNTVQGIGLRFVPTTESTILLTESLPVNAADSTIYTIIKRERLEYYNMETYSQEEIDDDGETPTPQTSTVRMDLAIQFREFKDDDKVYMPMGRDADVVQLTLDILRNEKIIEIRNN